MSGAVRNPDDDVRLDHELSAFAPKRARWPVPEQHNIDAPSGAGAGSPPVMQEPPWKRPSLKPEWLPPPPPPTRTESVLVVLARFAGVIVIAAAGAVGSLWGVGYFSASAPQPQVLLATDQANTVAYLAANPPAARPKAPVARSGLAPVSADDTARRAVDRAALPVQHPAPPVPDPQSASAPHFPASPTSAPPAQSGRPTSPGPASAPATSRPLDAAGIAVMLKSAAEYMANGNVAASRLMLRPAADAGDAAAAFALAETYDPMVLARLGTKGGITPDIALAQQWYAKATALGSSAAHERLVRLTRRSE
jgi:hypothetical protein